MSGIRITKSKYKEVKKIFTQFFIPLKKIPTVTHQQKKINFKTKTIYEDDNLKAARSLFESILAHHKPEIPFKGPIRLIVKWLFQKNVVDVKYKTTKPDLDNAQKLLMDCMTKVGFWKDDAEVASMVLEKFWVNDMSGIWIHVEEIWDE